MDIRPPLLDLHLSMLKEFIANGKPVCGLDLKDYQTCLGMALLDMAGLIGSAVRHVSDPADQVSIVKQWDNIAFAQRELLMARQALPEPEQQREDVLIKERRILKEALLAAMETVRRITPDPRAHLLAEEVIGSLALNPA